MTERGRASPPPISSFGGLYGAEARVGEGRLCDWMGGAMMPTKTIRFINSQNLLLNKLMDDVSAARNSLNNAVMLCLSELGVPNGVDVTFDDVLASRSFTWEVPDAEKQPPHGPEVEGV